MCSCRLRVIEARAAANLSTLTSVILELPFEIRYMSKLIFPTMSS